METIARMAAVKVACLSHEDAARWRSYLDGGRGRVQPRAFVEVDEAEPVEGVVVVMVVMAVAVATEMEVAACLARALAAGGNRCGFRIPSNTPICCGKCCTCTLESRDSSQLVLRRVKRLSGQPR